MKQYCNSSFKDKALKYKCIYRNGDKPTHFFKVNDWELGVKFLCDHFTEDEKVNVLESLKNDGYYNKDKVKCSITFKKNFIYEIIIKFAMGDAEYTKRILAFDNEIVTKLKIELEETLKSFSNTPFDANCDGFKLIEVMGNSFSALKFQHRNVYVNITKNIYRDDYT